MTKETLQAFITDNISEYTKDADGVTLILFTHELPEFLSLIYDYTDGLTDIFEIRVSGHNCNIKMDEICKHYGININEVFK